jgi:hypothetical protein
MLPDGTKLNIGPEYGYDTDALAYLYFNSELVKDMVDYKYEN